MKFQNDVYRHKTEATGSYDAYVYAPNFRKDADPPEDHDIVIYARESYMIFPTKDDKDAARDRNFGNPVIVVGDPLPTEVQVNRENEADPYAISGTDPVYRFIGNFNSGAKIPRYSYAYGVSNGERKFFILNTDKALWSPFKSIVQNTARDGGNSDWENFFKKNQSSVKQTSLFGDDEEITGIDNIIIEVSSDNDEDLRVFNLNGSMMGNSLQGLPAGTYIQGGKAYRVK